MVVIRYLLNRAFWVCAWWVLTGSSGHHL